ncbi:TonB-dependent receptor [Fontimonas sp. SYSU GA230001]|uniref:TonB-dependent receptor domain-containing protein n=1 Tax=Fontimonas sp. SYSU GA230001 TaxID=3142450 RepID=UPI0032B36E34
MKRLLLAACAAIPACASAQQSTPLDPIVVTATRDARPASALSASVEVLDRGAIERLQANDLADLLRQVAGLDVARSGGAGSPASVFIRGAESNHTLFLIDGVRYTTESFLNAQIQNLAPEAIERIEIVKGPRSALWGSDAIGGVVNIITRQAGRGFGGGASLRGGSYGTLDTAGRIAWGGDAGGLSLDVQRQDFDGYPPLRSGTRDLGHENLNIAARGAMQLGGVTLTARHLQAAGTNEYVAFGSERAQDYRNRVSAAEASTTLPGGGQTRLVASLAYDELRQRQPSDAERPQLRDFTEVERRNLEWLAEYSLAGVDLGGGLTTGTSDIHGVFYSSFGDSVTDDRTERHAAFAQASTSFGRIDGLMALRYTHHDQFGAATTGNVEIGLRAWSGARLGLAAGTGFKEPELTDLFGPYGNPGLDPERSRSLELNLRQTLGTRQVVTLAAYETRIDDLIGYDPDSFALVNIDQSRTRGVEAGWRYADEQFDARLSGTVQDPRDRTTGDRLLRRSAASAQAALGYRWGRFEPGIDVQAYGARRDRYTDPATFETTPVRLGGYALVNASLRVQLFDGLSLALRGENLLDKDYELVRGYRTPAASGYVTLRYAY